MKKTRRLLAMVTAIIMVLFTITGCENASSVTSSSTQQTSTIVEATPTVAEVAEPTPEVAEPTEAPVEEPTPTEVVDAGPVIEGIDFAPYIKGIEFGQDIVQKCDFNEPRLIFLDGKKKDVDGEEKYVKAPFEEGGYAILKNGETYKRIEDHKFYCFFYTKKQIDEAYLNNDLCIYLKSRMNESGFSLWANYFDMDTLGYAGGTKDCSIDITYDDGTTETFTFTVTDA